MENRIGIQRDQRKSYIRLNSENNHIILFDGVCNLCNKIVKFIIKRDKIKRFKFASLQSEIGKFYLKKFELPNDKLDTFVYIRYKKSYTRSSAGLYVLKDLGGIWKLFFGFIIFPVFLRDFFYNLIAKSRYKIWGKKDSCMIPSQNISERFIDQN